MSNNNYLLILYFLYLSPGVGEGEAVTAYTISRWSGRSVNVSRKALNSLVEKGWAEVNHFSYRDNASKHIYRLTQAGEEHLFQNWQLAREVYGGHVAAQYYKMREARRQKVIENEETMADIFMKNLATLE